MRIRTVIELVATAVTLAITPQPKAPPPSYFEGSLSRYAPGVFEQVLDWRYTHGVPAGFNPWQAEYDGYVAVVDCRNVGRDAWLWITIEGVERAEPYHVYVSDCATPGTAAAEWMRKHRIAAEVDFEAWQRWGVVDGRGAWVKVVLGG